MKCATCQERPPDELGYGLCTRCAEAREVAREQDPTAIAGVRWIAARARRFERRRNAERLATAMRFVDDVRERLAQAEDARRQLAADVLRWQARAEAADAETERVAGALVIAERERDELRALVTRIVARGSVADEWHPDFAALLAALGRS